MLSFVKLYFYKAGLVEVQLFAPRKRKNKT